jgi:PAS domain S-box-containing protein
VQYPKEIFDHHAQLLDRETRLKIALRTARLGSWEWDLSSNAIEASDECKAVFDLAPGDAFSYEIAIGMVHPEDRDLVSDLLGDAINGDKSFEAEYRLLWRDGSIHWVRTSGQVIYNRFGKPLRMVGVTMDITERRLQDEERDLLLAREQQARLDAESANQAKDRFLAMVSHELRSPLNAILGWTHLIKSRKVSTQMAAKAIDVIERNATHQARMIEDLLDFSRIVAGNLRLRVERVRLKDIIQNVVDSLTLAAEETSVTVTCDVRPESLHVEGDSMRLQQVVYNLVSNSLKFTPEHGSIAITARSDGSFARIQVIDSGSGIPADFLPYVFERFRQADKTASRRHGGLGLGLAIVKNVVELHGGRVSVFSAGADLGSTFTIEIPLANGVGQSFQQDIADAAQGDLLTDTLSGLRILVVDDEAAVRKMLKAFLENHGAEVRPSATAGEAMEELEQWTPNVLLSDIAMPDEDGLSLISRIRVMESASARQVLAIALTAHMRDADRLKALAAGYHLFVPKSVKPDELVNTIATLVREGP